MEIKEGMKTNCPNRLWAVNQVLVFKNSFTFFEQFCLARATATARERDGEKLKRNKINYIND